jgi:hypothetical protein
MQYGLRHVARRRGLAEHGGYTPDGHEEATTDEAVVRSLAAEIQAEPETGAHRSNRGFVFRCRVRVRKVPQPHDLDVQARAKN